MNAQQNAPISDRVSSLSARVFSYSRHIVKREGPGDEVGELFKTDFPRVLRFPVPLDKGNEDSWNEIRRTRTTRKWFVHAQVSERLKLSLLSLQK